MHRARLLLPPLMLASWLTIACSDDTAGQDGGTAPDQQATQDLRRDLPVKTDSALKDAPPDKAPPDKAPPDKAPPDKAPPDKAPPDKAPPDKAPPDKAPPDKGGNLPLGAACSTANDKCGPGLKCCLTCCGQPLPDGSTTPTHTCVTPGKGGQCPPPPPSPPPAN